MVATIELATLMAPELASLHGRREHAQLLWMLRKPDSLEEAGLSVEDLPLLTKSIRIVNDGFTITGNHVVRSEITKVLGPSPT